jgi:hypothetical protein
LQSANKIPENGIKMGILAKKSSYWTRRRLAKRSRRLDRVE